MESLEMFSEKLLHRMRDEAIECAANFENLSEEERNVIYEQAVAVYRLCRHVDREGLMAIESVSRPTPLDIIGECVMNGMDINMIIEQVSNQYEIREHKENTDAFVWYISLRGIHRCLYQNHLHAVKPFLASLIPKRYQQEYRLAWERLVPETKSEPVHELLLNSSSTTDAERKEVFFLELLEELILKLNDDESKIFLENNNRTDIALAWKVLHKNVKEKIVGRMSEYEKELLYNEYIGLGPVPMCDVYDAMTKLMRQLVN